MFLITFSAFSQSSFICKSEASPAPVTSIDCTDDASGKFGVALVIHMLRYSDGSGGVSSGEIPNILNKIKSAFEPHGIYFMVKCINEIHSTSLYNVSSNSELLALGGAYEDPTAINLFLTAGGSGIARVPGNMTIAGYTPIYPEANTVIHELGHCLGLLHTFAGTGSYHGTDSDQSGSSNLPEYVDGSNCCTAGDLVCDTPADPNITTILPQFGGTGVDIFNCTWTVPPVVDQQGDQYNNPVPGGISNYMSYYYGNDVCSTTFTSGQGARMRATLDQVAAMQAVRRDEFLIDGLTIWDSDMYPDVDVIVFTGGRLEIEGADVYNGAPRFKPPFCRSY